MKLRHLRGGRNDILRPVSKRGNRFATAAVVLTGLILPMQAGCARGCDMFHVSNEELTTTEARAVAFAAYRYRETVDSGTCPTVDQLFDKKELGPDQRYDRWNSPFAITCSGARIDAISAGPDRRLGTRDDIVESVIPGGGGSPEAQP
jgi:hypothetical protein